MCRVRVLAQGGTISVQVLNEFANAARRKVRRPWPEIKRALVILRALCPLPRTVATHESALALVSRHDFAFYDALVVASALEAGCVTLPFEDMRDGQVVQGRLTIRDPFRQG